MDDAGPSLECELCGGTDFYKESGHFYCNECQTQSQQVQEHVFEQDTINKKSARKIQSSKEVKQEEMLTSWECFNYILKGLTKELLSLGAKPELKQVVRCLWMKYLHKCEVFQLHSNQPPKLNILGPKRDIAVLYNVKKQKRKRNRTSSVSTTASMLRDRTSKKRALVQSQYREERSQVLSQNLTQDSLSSLRSDSAVSQESVKISYNKFSERELRLVMSKNHIKRHKKDLHGELTCHKINSRDLRPDFCTGPANLTSFVLYEIIYIGLLIVEDSIQLGDLLRFIKEGHISFACYRQFFPESLPDKSLILPKRKEKLFNHAFFRRRCLKLVHFLEVGSYINTPDLSALCTRYCQELNLPEDIRQSVQHLVDLTAPKMALKVHSKAIPNYEGRVMSYIIFTLKLLFGLDGVTEKKLSEYTKLVNNLKSKGRKFDFLEWLQFLKHRTATVSKHHLPTALAADSGSLDSDLYLNYLRKAVDLPKSKHIHGEIKDYLQVLEKFLPDIYRGSEGVFEPSLTPHRDYAKSSTKDFTNHSLDHLLHPQQFLQALGTWRIQYKGANDKVITESYLHLYRNRIKAQRKGTKKVAVRITPWGKQDKFVGEFLQEENSEVPDSEVLLDNWNKFYEEECSKHHQLLPTTAEILYPEHYNPFQRYWMNLPINPIAHYFSKQDMEKIAAKMPAYFRDVLGECARVVEQDVNDFYGEFLVTELFLANYDFRAGKVKGKSEGVIDIRTTLAAIRRHW